MRIIILVTILLFCSSCGEEALNIKRITVTGCVRDSTTNAPLPNAKVTLLCWYHAGWDKTDYVSIDTTTDKNGCIRYSFEKGYKVIVASIAPGFEPSVKEAGQLKSNNIALNIVLKRAPGENRNINLRYLIVESTSSE